RFGCIILGDLTADDLAVERQRLEDDVEAAAVLVREHQAEIEPVVVLAVALDDRIGTVRRCVRLSVRHWNSPCRAGCDVLREQAPRRDAWRLPARIAVRRNGGDCGQRTRGWRFVKAGRLVAPCAGFRSIEPSD